MNSHDYKKILKIVVAAGVVMTAIFGILRVLASIHVPAQSSSFWTAVCWWAIITITMFVVANVLFFVVGWLSPTPMNAAMTFSTFWATAAFAAIILTIFFLFKDDPGRQPYAFISVIGGAAVGWLLGMYFSPKDSSEQQEFGKIQAAVAALASGYTLKSIQDFAFKSGNEHYRPYLLLASITAILMAATIYNVRAYGLSTVHISFDKAPADKTDAKTVSVNSKGIVIFRAAVTGHDDTSVRWSVIPDPKIAAPLGEVDEKGKFTAGKNTGTAPVTCQIKAESVSDPKLCDVVTVIITGSS